MNSGLNIAAAPNPAHNLFATVQADLANRLLRFLVAAVGEHGCQCYRCNVLARCAIAARDPNQARIVEHVLSAILASDAAAEAAADADKASALADSILDDLEKQLPPLPAGGCLR